MLRVFGSPSFDDLITLIRPWARVGTIEHLEGADSVGARDDVRTAAARGQIEDALVKSDEELMRKLAGLSLLPDADLRFHRHAFQCTGATWKRAILAMLDRADAVVAPLYDPLHPAVLRLVADVIAEGARQGKSVSVCGEMAGDVGMTRLLLGLGLRSFSMQPAQILAVKQEVLRVDARKLADWAQQVLASDDPAAMLAQ